MEDDPTVVVTASLTLGEQFVKTLFAASAGFVASKLVESVFEKAMAARKIRSVGS